jgi:DNA repair ATPase RecN
MAGPATHVIKRFPEHELTIERLVRKSESFRGMCEDYAVGVEALWHWEREADPELSARIAEIRESLDELEQEMLEELKQEAPSRSGKSR